MVSMNNQEWEELSKKESLGSGRFGIVYPKDDMNAYKIYFKQVADDAGFYHDNPCILFSKKRFQRLIEKCQELEFTDGISDMIQIERNFAGIAMPRQYGTKVCHMMDEPLSKRIQLAKLIVRNAKELTDHHIYHCDYKLDNMIYQGDNVQIVDLDDIHTHFSPLYYHYSIDILGLTLAAFMKDDLHLAVPRSVHKKLLRADTPCTYTYRAIDHYLQEKERPKDILWIDSDTDLSLIPFILQKHDYSVVYLLDDVLEDSEYKKLYALCVSESIPLYDMALKKNVSKYPEFDTIRSDTSVYEYQYRKVI